MPAQRNSSDLTIVETANELHTDHKFVRKLIRDGHLPAYRIKGSRLIRIRRADVDALKQPVGGAL
jgi:excisionase family DNA binding protein